MYYNVSAVVYHLFRSVLTSSSSLVRFATRFFHEFTCAEKKKTHEKLETKITTNTLPRSVIEKTSSYNLGLRGLSLKLVRVFMFFLSKTVDSPPSSINGYQRIIGTT